MKLLLNIGHPAHVHLFKNMIKNLEKDGHKVNIVTRDKDVTLKLLDAYGFEYEVVSGYYNTMTGKMYDFLKTFSKLLKISVKSKPDILMGVADLYGAYIGKLIGKPSIVLTDTEHAKLQNKLTFPFATVICTPSCFKEDLGKKQVRYNGYHELAYLHPNYFEPDASVLDDLGLSKDDKFVIMRFVSWSASHDVGLHGFDLKTKQRFIEELEKHGRVFITSEAKLENEFEKYRISIPPEKIHDLLYYATLYVGESATIASEAAIMGTPSICVSPLKYGYIDEESQKYKLVIQVKDITKGKEKVLKEAIELLENPDIKKEWQKRKERLLKDKIDVTEFMTRFIEEYANR